MDGFARYIDPKPALLARMPERTFTHAAAKIGNVIKDLHKLALLNLNLNSEVGNIFVGGYQHFHQTPGD